MKNKNIEELVKNAFEQFEPEVPSHLWDNIQSQIAVNPSGAESAASNGGSSASGGWAGGTALLKVAVTALVISGGAYLAYNYVNSDETEAEIAITGQVESNEQDAASNEPSNPVEDSILLEESDNSTESEPINEWTEEESIENNEEGLDITEEVEFREQSEEQIIDDITNSSVKSSLDKPSNVDNNSSSSQISSATNPSKVKKQNNEVTIVESGILANKVSGEVPLTIHFSNITGAQYFEWDFGNGKKSFDPSPSITFDQDGDFTVKLTITDYNGNQLSDRMEINTYLPSTLFVPNAFSPNGDGENDFFGVEGENVSNVNFKILRLDGTTVFEGKSIFDRWDGLDAQNPLSDKYLIVATAIGSDGKPIVKNAFLQVFRDGNR